MADSMSARDPDSTRPEYVSIYPSDWIGGCSHLPPMVEWLYFQISLHNMDKGEPVPENRLPLLMVRHGGDWQADLALLLDIGKVHKTNGGGYFVKRALIEYQRAENALSKKKRAGKRGAEKRWKSDNLDSTANGTATENQCDTNSIREEKKREEVRDTNVSPPYSPPEHQGDFVFSVDPNLLAAFRQHRIEIEKPLTKVGEARLIKKLERIWDEHHHPPNLVLQQSIDEVWIGVFPLKEDRQGRSGWDFVRGGS